MHGFQRQPLPPPASLDPPPTDEQIAAMSFELALSTLQAVTRRLESQAVSLEQAINDYEIGTKLQAQAQSKLDEARLKLEQLTRNRDGSPRLSPFTDPRRRHDDR